MLISYQHACYWHEFALQSQNEIKEGGLDL